METLKKGVESEKVRVLQHFLNLAAKLQGRPHKLKEDGDFGQKTEDALFDLVGVKTVPPKLQEAMVKTYPMMVERANALAKGTPAPDRTLRNLIQTDQQVFQNLLVIYAIYEKATPQQRERYKTEFARAFNVAVRLMKRYKTMLASGQVMVLPGYPAKYKPLVQRYVTSQGVKGIGVAPLVVIGVVALCGIFAGGVAAYGIMAWLTPAYSESTVDFKVTKEVEAALSKLPESDRETILKEVEKQIDKAYVTGKRDGKTSGFFGGTKTMLFVGAIVGGYFLVLEPALEKRNKRRSAA